MAALGGIAGSDNRLISFFQRTKALLAEAEQYISIFPFIENIDEIEMLHERLSEAGETVLRASQGGGGGTCSLVP